MDIIEIGDWTYCINIEWRPIIFKGILTDYEVSNIGEVRNKISGKMISQYTDRDGYKHASITINGKVIHRGVHRFVATAFIPNPENKPQVNHINGIKYINIVDNLEWVTNSENVRHAFDTGLKYAIKGSNNVLSHYTDKQIHQVCKMLEKGISNKKISDKTGVDRKYITDIKKDRRWKHISKNYNIKQNKYTKEFKESITSQIIKELNIKNSPSHKSLIMRLRRNIRVSASTTIETLRESRNTFHNVVSRVEPKLMMALFNLNRNEQQINSEDIV